MPARDVDDTHPDIEAIIIEGYRRMTPAEKLERVRALTQAVQQLALADIRRSAVGGRRGAHAGAG